MKKNRNKNKKKGPVRMILLIGLFTIVGVLLFVIGINLFVSISARKYVVSEIDELPAMVDAIIVPGAGLTTDNQPGTVLQDRLDTAIELYESGVSNRILMSGDHGDDYHNEVRAMKDYAISFGVPADAIFMDHAGFNTYDTMVRAKEVFQVNSCIIVTQEYHLLRSVYVARGIDLDAYGFASELQIDQMKYVPFELREILARVKDFFSVIFRPDPTCLGDPIPITGKGSQTD